MACLRFHLRTLVLVVVAAALVLAVERATRRFEPEDRHTLMLLSAILALIAVPFLASVLGPSGRLWIRRSVVDPQAELLREICGVSKPPPRRKGPSRPAVPRHLEFLVDWAKVCLVLILGLAVLYVTMERDLEAPEHQEAAAVAWMVFVAAVGFLALWVVVLSATWIWQYHRFLNDQHAAAASRKAARPPVRGR